jgi:CheY-like chemotaxis protein
MSISDRPTILVVEDDDDIRENLREFLELEGYAVMAAPNGREGLVLVAAATGPLLVLLDLQMPIMNGEQFLAALRADPEPRRREIPVVVLTARGQLPTNLGASAYMKKPLDLDRLLATLQALSPR